MKTRAGFVSNSSSTSFCIMGVAVSENNYEKLYLLTKETDLDYYIDCYDDRTYVGLEPNEMKDTETLAEFKQRALEQLNKTFPDESHHPEWITEYISS